MEWAFSAWMAKNAISPLPIAFSRMKSFACQIYFCGFVQIQGIAEARLSFLISCCEASLPFGRCTSRRSNNSKPYNSGVAKKHYIAGNLVVGFGSCDSAAGHTAFAAGCFCDPTILCSCLPRVAGAEFFDRRPSHFHLCALFWNLLRCGSGDTRPPAAQVGPAGLRNRAAAECR